MWDYDEIPFLKFNIVKNDIDIYCKETNIKNPYLSTDYYHPDANHPSKKWIIYLMNLEEKAIKS